MHPQFYWDPFRTEQWQLERYKLKTRLKNAERPRERPREKHEATRTIEDAIDEVAEEHKDDDMHKIVTDAYHETARVLGIRTARNRRMAFPEPDIEQPTFRHVRAATMAQAAYAVLEDPGEAQEALDAIDFKLLHHTKYAIAAADEDGGVHIAFRGAASGNRHTGARDKADVIAAIKGQKIDYAEERAFLGEMMDRYPNQIESVSGYSNGGAKVHQFAREGILGGIPEIDTINPHMGLRDATEGVPDFVQITRTREDFSTIASGIGVNNGVIDRNQIKVIRGLEGAGDHDLDNFFPHDEPRGMTINERIVHDHLFSPTEAPKNALQRHATLTNFAIGAATGLGSSALVEAIGSKQPEALKAAESTGLSAVVQGAAKRGLGVGLGSTFLSSAALEVPGAFAGLGAGMAVQNALEKRRKVGDDDPRAIGVEAGIGAASGAAGGLASELATAGGVIAVNAARSVIVGEAISLGLAEAASGALLASGVGAVVGAALLAGFAIWRWRQSKKHHHQPAPPPAPPPPPAVDDPAPFLPPEVHVEAPVVEMA